MSDRPSILHVARTILETFFKNGSALTPLKLQKLLYYSQAWSLVWQEKPLFDDDFQAWANGPVNPTLYQKHRGLYVLGKDFLSEFSGFKYTTEDKETIDAVLAFYGDKEPFYLSELTHKELPWKAARTGIAPGEPSDKIIEKSVMQEYYTGISSVVDGK